MQARPRMLIVDDEPGVLDVLTDIFRNDYAIQVALDGKQALARAKAAPPPEIILLDAVMPEMDGFQVLQKLQEDDSTRDIPVIFVTGKNDAGSEERGLKLGAVDYITKPISPVIVRARVGTHIKIQQAAKRERALFGQFLDPAVVKRILKTTNGHVPPPEERRISVLFADIVGFTGLSERNPPQQVFDMLSAFLNSITEDIREQQGTLDKYIGDAAMALWGAPQEQEDHARRAVTCALNIRRSLVEDPALSKHGLDCRIGISSGEAVIGAIGSALRAEYTAIGDTVNRAARLENANGLYHTRILIDQATADDVSDMVNLRTIGPIRVKGREASVVAYEVLGFASEAPPSWLEDYERAYQALQEDHFDLAVELLAKVVVVHNDRTVRNLLDKALALRDPDTSASGA